MILGIDVGGTHTDSVLMNNRKIIRKSKVLTDKENILKSVLMATEAVARPEDIKNLQRIVLSTTLTTNAVVQNQLDPVGLVVMNGPGVSPKDLPLYDKANYIAGYMSHRGIGGSTRPCGTGGTEGKIQKGKHHAFCHCRQVFDQKSRS